MIKGLTYLLIFLGIWIIFFKNDRVEYGPGVLAPHEPLQTKIELPKPFVFKEELYTPLANFSIQAKVLSKENYSLDRGAAHSPTDLALGWGRMSDESIIEHIEISQSGRWYRWRAEKLPIPIKEIERSSANMHMIPANEEVASILDDIKEGHIIRLKGKLVRIDSPDGGHWQSSLSRNDTGGGSCELIFVEQLNIEEILP